MSKKKDDSGILLYDWMFRLKLTPSQREVYALVVSYNRNDLEFYGSDQKIAERLSMHRNSVNRTIKELCSMNLLTKKVFPDGVRVCKAIIPSQRTPIEQFESKDEALVDSQNDSQSKTEAREKSNKPTLEDVLGDLTEKDNGFDL